MRIAADKKNPNLQSDPLVCGKRCKPWPRIALRVLEPKLLPHEMRTAEDGGAEIPRARVGYLVLQDVKEGKETQEEKGGGEGIRQSMRSTWRSGTSEKVSEMRSGDQKALSLTVMSARSQTCPRETTSACHFLGFPGFRTNTVVQLET